MACGRWKQRKNQFFHPFIISFSFFFCFSLSRLHHTPTLGFYLSFFITFITGSSFIHYVHYFLLYSHALYIFFVVKNASCFSFIFHTSPCGFHSPCISFSLLSFPFLLPSLAFCPSPFLFLAFSTLFSPPPKSFISSLNSLWNIYYFPPSFTIFSVSVALFSDAFYYFFPFTMFIHCFFLPSSFLLSFIGCFNSTFFLYFFILISAFSSSLIPYRSTDGCVSPAGCPSSQHS